MHQWLFNKSSQLWKNNAKTEALKDFASLELLSSDKGRLILMFVVALGLTFLTLTSSATASKLFQSPQSPQSPPPTAEQPAGDQAAPATTPAPVEQPLPTTEAPITTQESEVPVVPATQEPVLEPPQTFEQFEPEAVEEGSSSFTLDEAEFIDTLIVSGAYLWLCCGLALLLLVPLVLIFLYIRGRRRIADEEGF
ncbi:MAG: hypothetical protein AAF485_24145 [Chloroflexota bacterium]